MQRFFSLEGHCTVQKILLRLMWLVLMITHVNLCAFIQPSSKWYLRKTIFNFFSIRSYIFVTLVQICSECWNFQKNRIRKRSQEQVVTPHWPICILLQSNKTIFFNFNCRIETSKNSHEHHLYWLHIWKIEQCTESFYDVTVTPRLPVMGLQFWDAGSYIKPFRLFFSASTLVKSDAPTNVLFRWWNLGTRVQISRVEMNSGHGNTVSTGINCDEINMRNNSFLL